MLGGINALAFGVSQMSAKDCQKSFNYLAKSIFNKPDNWFGFPSLIKDALRLFFKDSMYDRNGIETALMRIFGHIKMIGQRYNKLRYWEPIKVAVTTKETTTSLCSLLTNYNKSSHPSEPSYNWAQAKSTLKHLKVWEA